MTNQQRNGGTMRNMHTTKTNHYEWFDSLYDMATFAKANTNRKSSDREDHGDWSKSKNLDEAVGFAMQGWHDVRPMVDQYAEQLQERINDTLSDHYVVQHDVTGADVNIGLFMAGEPECMMQFVTEPQARMGRVVKVLVNGCTSASTNADNIIKRGAAVLTLVNTLHLMGVGVELWWEDAITGSDKKGYSTAVKLHDSAQPLDIDNVMFALAHPSMLRRVCFSVQEQSPHAGKQGAGAMGGGYGIPTECMLNKMFDFDVVVERLQRSDDPTVRNGVGWIVDRVTGLGLVEA
jgi:hypothetical protein